MPEPLPTRREENARATRSMLLATARELFGQRGFTDVGIEETAARAGVTTGALYHHFGSKRGLFRAVVEGIEAELMERAVAVGAQHSDPWRALEAGISATLEASLARDVQQIILRDAPTVLGATEWRAITDQYELGMLRAAVGGLMGSGVIALGSPEMVARALIALIGELAASVADAADGPSARREAERLIRSMLAALRPE